MHITSFNRPIPGDSLMVLNAKLQVIGKNEENEIINIDDYIHIKKIFGDCYTDKDFVMIENINGYDGSQSKIYHTIDDMINDDVVVINGFDNKIIGRDAVQ